MISKHVNIRLSGEDITREFWELSPIEQAKFFNNNALAQYGYDFGCAVKQINEFIDFLDDDGKAFIRHLYSVMLTKNMIGRCKQNEKNL